MSIILQSWADQNEKETDVCDQHLERMLSKVYSGRQVERNNSSQHKIDHRIKGVNDHNGETQEEENFTQDDRKTENKTQECDFKIHEHNRNDEEMNKLKRSLELKKRKLQNQKITKMKKLKRMKRSLW